MRRIQEKHENAMNETHLKYYQKLKNGERLHSKSVPKIILNSPDFQNMLRANIISKVESGNGFVFVLNGRKKEIFFNFFNNAFPNENIQVVDRASNIAKFKNSKSIKTASLPILFLRGVKQVEINDQSIDLNHYTNNFGLFATVLQSLKTDKICFIENKETFLVSEKIIPEDYICLHSYGRIGKQLLRSLIINQILVFSDYDYIGLNEYLKCKEYFENTILFLPSNYDELCERYATDITKKGRTGQKPSTRVLKSTDCNVMKIREQIQRTQKFLEQEILLYEC